MRFKEFLAYFSNSNLWKCSEDKKSTKR